LYGCGLAPVLLRRSNIYGGFLIGMNRFGSRIQPLVQSWSEIKQAA
jgi:hypothetical protein